MVTHDENRHMSQPVQRYSGNRVQVAHMNKFGFERWESETSWTEWIPSEFSNYQKQREIHYRAQ